MKFDDRGHLVCTPPELYQHAVENPHRLLNAFLMGGTPVVFDEYDRYCSFLETVSDSTGVHAKNLYVRGSCHIGFSIAPKIHKIWRAVRRKSDIDLVIVDADYFHRCEQELRRWEARNPITSPQGKGTHASTKRAQDRRFNCFRDKNLPKVVCAHHQKMMKKIAALAHCGHVREVSAFIYPDWHSAQEKYEFDLRELCQGVEKGALTPPPGEPLPRDAAH